MSDTGWREIRDQVRQRDGCQCVMCRVVDGLTIHHLIPRHISHDDSLHNLVTLCRSCHDYIEALDAVPAYLDWFATLIQRDSLTTKEITHANASTSYEGADRPSRATHLP
jgi:5-methylcytosine-specific restriction endonuclease McrA